MTPRIVINKILSWSLRILTIMLGVFFIVFGERDDSPGLQGLGLLLIITTVIIAIKNKKNTHS